MANGVRASLVVAGLRLCQFGLELLDPLLKLGLLPLQFLVLGLQLLHVGVRWSAQHLLNELNGITWLLWLLIQAHKNCRVHGSD